MKRLSCLLTVGILSCSILAAQGDENKPLKDAVIENIQIVMQLENIQLSFLVRDADGNYIPNLGASDFMLVENGHPQSISALREEELPISAVVMVDTSWSIGYFLDNAVRTAVDFFKGLQKERSAFVLFSETPNVVLNWNDPATDLTAHLRDVKPNGKTSLHDSVIWVAENLFKDRQGKKLIILLTDGIDTKSDASFERMMRTTREHGISLYPIIYTNEYIQNYRKNLKLPNFQTRRRVSQDFHNLILQQNQFVDQSLRYGGRTIFSNAFADLRDIYSNIIHEMKSQYVMLYQSSAEEGEDQRREVKIQTKTVPGKIFINISH